MTCTVAAQAPQKEVSNEVEDDMIEVDSNPSSIDESKQAAVWDVIKAHGKERRFYWVSTNNDPLSVAFAKNFARRRERNDINKLVENIGSTFCPARAPNMHRILEGLDCLQDLEHRRNDYIEPLLQGTDEDRDKDRCAQQSELGDFFLATTKALRWYVLLKSTAETDTVEILFDTLFPQASDFSVMVSGVFAQQGLQETQHGGTCPGLAPWSQLCDDVFRYTEQARRTVHSAAKGELPTVIVNPTPRARPNTPRPETTREGRRIKLPRKVRSLGLLLKGKSNFSFGTS